MTDKILVVDDEIDTLHLIEVKLSRAGYSIMTARDGNEGIKLAEQERPSLVILDLMMPDIDGYTVCQHLKRELETPPVVLILSAKEKTEDIAAAFAAGADDYMIKPFSPSELVERVRVNLIHHGRVQDNTAS